MVNLFVTKVLQQLIQSDFLLMKSAYLKKDAHLHASAVVESSLESAALSY